MNTQGKKAPVCAKRDHIHTEHGVERYDPYYWLRDKENQEVIQYLNDENEYTSQVMADTQNLQDSLYEEMLARIKQQDESVPYFKNDYWYYTRFEEGKEYPIFCRKKGNLKNEEIVLLNVNELAEGHAYYQIGGLSISEDNDWIAYSVDTQSRRIYTIYFKNLTTGEVSEQAIANTTGSAVWSANNDIIFYTTKNEETLRSDTIYRYTRSSSESVLVYHEPDEAFYAHIHKSKSRKYLIIGATSTLTSEYRFVEANEPTQEFRLFQSRVRGMEYGIAHFQDHFYILTNWEAKNFRLMKCGLEHTDRSNWQEEIPHRADTLLEGMDLFNDFMVLEERSKGLTQIRIKQFSAATDYYMRFDDETYTAGTSVNPEYNTQILRFGYTSMTTPSSTYDFDMATQEKTLLKQTEIVGGYDSSAYDSKRLYITARDGVEVPVSIVFNRKFPPSANTPLLLYGYGSYGHSMDPYFSSLRLSLLNRGISFAIAHIRGGEEMGRSWYDDGKLLNKLNTFNDFIDIADYLVNNEYTSTKHMYAMGGSAGGLLVGAVMNMRPDLWNGIFASVPFVDVVTTMFDESIPLTTGEFDEWGNPKDKEFFDYIMKYSPYDNVEEKDYPNILVTTGFHDSQVQYWEPAKWVAKLRDLKTDNNILLFKTEMEFGHSGASGRFQRIKEVALEYTYLLSLEGITS